METLAAIIILSPILVPIANAVGINTIHFGIIMVLNLAIGFITPPLGVNLFVACGISKISLEDISKGVLPFVVVMVILLMAITFIPQLSLFLPNLMK
jgi:C4-dicarboxylate transporter DctM subunit